VRIFAAIADAQNCAIELAHHTRKLLAGSTSDYVVDDMRGASAIKDAVRAARTLNQMAEKDAEAVGIPEHERSAYFRVDRVKGNNAPPSKAVWRHFVNVEPGMMSASWSPGTFLDRGCRHLKKMWQTAMQTTCFCSF
jgi:hypothetical protein